ncbi:MAG: hypothetical protein QOK00_1010 [Thermoleophilaceae bacterium]|jgi:type IV secretory pathway TrbD component|nr:hypothetical protein [Thermoleophilaceae bacterium]MEA2456257.1 hypothetical protein [Thermoleophilaceae bacterium]
MADEEVHTDGAQAPPPGEPVHLPGPSYLPVVTALGLTLAVVGVVLSWIVTGIGVVIALIAVWRWVRDTRQDISELPLEH